MLAVVKETPIENSISLLDVPLPDAQDGWLIVKVEYAGLCGSDLHTYAWTPDYQQRFKGLLPAVIGHEYTGTVHTAGPGVDNLPIGTRVVSRTPTSCGRCLPCLSGQEAICDHRQLLGVHYSGAMAEYVAVPAINCHALPGDYSAKLAALSEPISISFGAVHKTGSLLGKNVVIIGPGPIGYFIALLARLSGAAGIFLLGLPSDEERFAIFKSALPNIKIFREFEELLKQVKTSADRTAGVDVVFEASGAKSGPRMALQLLRKQGTMIQVGIFAKPPEVDLNTIVRNELIIKGTPAIPERLWRRALSLLTSLPTGEQAKFEAAITDIYSLQDSCQAFEKAIDKQGMKILLEP